MTPRCLPARYAQRGGDGLRAVAVDLRRSFSHSIASSLRIPAPSFQKEVSRRVVQNLQARGGATFSRRAASHSIHPEMPSPVVADTGRSAGAGITRASACSIAPTRTPGR